MPAYQYYHNIFEVLRSIYYNIFEVLRSIYTSKYIKKVELACIVSDISIARYQGRYFCMVTLLYVACSK